MKCWWYCLYMAFVSSFQMWMFHFRKKNFEIFISNQNFHCERGLRVLYQNRLHSLLFHSDVHWEFRHGWDWLRIMEQNIRSRTNSPNTICALHMLTKTGKNCCALLYPSVYCHCRMTARALLLLGRRSFKQKKPKIISDCTWCTSAVQLDVVWKTSKEVSAYAPARR